MQCMRSDQKVGEDSFPFPPGHPVLPPYFGCCERCRLRDSLDSDMVARQEQVAFALRAEVATKFCIDNVANHE